MHAQTTTTPAQPTESIPAAARKAKAKALSPQPVVELDERTRSLIQKALLDPAGCTKEERLALDGRFPSARKPEVCMDWASVARELKALHDCMRHDDGKVGDDQGVVGDAYRKARRASQRDTGATAQLAAAIAVETIARDFTRDGTYANYAVNPDGIRHIAVLVGDLQHTVRALNRDYGVPGVAIDKVFFSGWREEQLNATSAHAEQIASSAEEAHDASPFDRAYGAWERAAVKNAALLEDSERACDALQQAHPMPDTLKRPNEPGCWYLTESSIQEATMPFDHKVELVNVLRHWRAAHDASPEHAANEAAEARSGEGYERAWSTFRSLMATRPTTTSQLLRKMEVLLKETVLAQPTEQMAGAIDTDGVAELISKVPTTTDDYEQRMLLDFYLDLQRIVGAPSPLEKVEPFDPHAWSQKFEALPGHELSSRGPIYHEPEAWGPGYLTDADFRVTDPAEIAAYWNAREAFDPQGTVEHAKYHPNFRTLPIIAGSIRTFEFIYGADDPRLAEKAALFERRNQQNKLPPLGKHLWDQLKFWEQKLVIEYAKARAELADAPIAIAAE